LKWTSLLETLDVHGILKSLLQHHNLKLLHLLHLVVRLMSLLFQICCMLSIAFCPNDIQRFISGVQSLVWSIIDPKKQNS
uniref:Uncharacterized protein n=1 Tax=Cyprinus carpio carpio TaxID=630221 RepID=A0A9J7YUU5_CYPCA